MPADPGTRRAWFAVLLGFAAGALAACAAQNPAAPPAPARPPVKIATVAVDVSALPSLETSPVAAWVRAALPGRIAHAFEGRMAPGDPDGARLDVRIASVVLGPIGAVGAALDGMSGEASLSGGADGRPETVTVTLPYAVSRTDLAPGGPGQPSLERRVDALAQAFADQLPGKFASGE